MIYTDLTKTGARVAEQFCPATSPGASAAQDIRAET